MPSPSSPGHPHSPASCWFSGWWTLSLPLAHSFPECLVATCSQLLCLSPHLGLLEYPAHRDLMSCPRLTFFPSP